MRSGDVFQQRPSDSRRSASASSSWPTPDTQNARDGSHARLESRQGSEGRHSGTTLTDAIRQWPTPTAGCKGPGGEGQREGGPTLQTAASQHSHQDQPTAPDGPPCSSAGHGSPLRSLWATPGAGDDRGPSPGLQAAKARHAAKGQHKQEGLRDQAPMWATPAAADASGGHMASAKSAERGGNRTLNRNLMEMGLPQRLNPDFVDWLMGWPPGHSQC